MTEDQTNIQETVEVSTEPQTEEKACISEENVVRGEESLLEDPATPKTRSRKVTTILLLVIIVLLTLLVVRSCQSMTTEQEKPCLTCSGNAGALVDGELELGSYEEIKAGLQAKVDESYMNVKININPVFETSESKGNLMIQNSKENKGHIKVYIQLDSDETVVYESPTIKPNQSIQEDSLTVPLEKGTYPCVAMFHILDPETCDKINEMGIRIDLTVLN